MLAAALERIDPEDRDLLLRHESEGVDLTTLAGQAHVTSGAIAMRLTRARAALRLEFMLAFRHVELPTDRCRPVLLALSAGDRRRQAALGAAAHLESCPTCAALAPPLTQRNRRIAGWLLVPAVESLRRAWSRLRGRQMYAIAAVVLISVTLLRQEPPHAFPPLATAVADPPATTTVSVPPSAVAPTPAITIASTPTTIATAVPATSVPSGGQTTTVSTAPCIVPTLVDQLDAARDVVCPIASTIVGAADEITTATIPAAPAASTGQIAPVDSVLGAVPGP